MALLGRLAVPADGLGVVLRNALPIGIHGAEIDLGASITLLGRLAVPVDGLGIVLRNAFPGVIHNAEIVLCGGMTLLRRLAEPASRFSLVGIVAAVVVQLQRKVELSLRVAALRFQAQLFQFSCMLRQQSLTKPPGGVAGHLVDESKLLRRLSVALLSSQ